MEKLLLDILQIAIVVRVGFTLIRWAIGGTKRQRKSIVSKVIQLISDRIHYYLDNAIKKQRKVLYPSSNSGKVIPLKKN